MTDHLDDLVRRRATAVEPAPVPGLEPDALWSAGRQRRRRRRGALAGAGTLLAAALAGGITASALGGNDSARGPAVAATPSGSPSPEMSPSAPSPSATPSPTPSPADTVGVTGPLANAIKALTAKGHDIYIDPGAPARTVIDTAETLQDIGAADIKVALLPASTIGVHQTPAQLAAELGTHLHDKNAVIIVIVGQQPGAAAGQMTGFPAGQAESVMINAQSSHAGPFTLANVQGALDTAIAIYVGQLSGQNNAIEGLLGGSPSPTSANQGVLGTTPYSATPSATPPTPLEVTGS